MQYIFRHYWEKESDYVLILYIALCVVIDPEIHFVIVWCGLNALTNVRVVIKVISYGRHHWKHAYGHNALCGHHWPRKSHCNNLVSPEGFNQYSPECKGYQLLQASLRRLLFSVILIQTLYILVSHSHLQFQLQWWYTTPQLLAFSQVDFTAL